MLCAKAHSADGIGRKVEFGGTMATQSFFLQSYIGREAELDFFLHTGKGNCGEND